MVCMVYAFMAWFLHYLFETCILKKKTIELKKIVGVSMGHKLHTPILHYCQLYIQLTCPRLKQFYVLGEN